MDIILDTNILRSDPLLSSVYFERLKNYVIHTKSAVILPRIVKEELRAIYQRDLSQKLATARKAVRELNGLLITPLPLPEDLSTEAQAEAYIHYIRKRLDFFYLIELDYSGEFLADVVNRAVNRVKPISENGQQFRDAVLWLSIIDCLKRNEGMGEKIFLSENFRDFADETKEQLHEQLRQELAGQKLTLKYCRSLRDFVQNYVARTEFITEDWLVEHINWEPLQKGALDCANGIHCGFFFEHFARKYPRYNLENYYVSRAYFEQSVSDFTVWESEEQGVFHVEAILGGRAYIRFFTAPDSSRWFYKWAYFGTRCYITIQNGDITEMIADFAEEETSLEY